MSEPAVPAQKPLQTMAEQEIERERAKLDKLAKEFIASKNLELQFEVKEQKEWFPEIGQVQKMINACEEQYFTLKKAGKSQEAKLMKYKLLEAKYSRYHLECVMNLDFTKPTSKMKKMAEEGKINMADPDIVNHFKRI